MEDRSIRKRKLTEDGGGPTSNPQSLSSSGVNSRPSVPPPIKKQYTGNGSDNDSPDTGATKDDEEPITAAEEVLINFQKEAIWRQMQEYKREHARAQEKIDKLQENKIDFESHLRTVDMYWDQLLEDLMMLIARVEIKLDVKDMVLKDGSSFAAMLRKDPEGSESKSKYDDSASNGISSAVEAKAQHTKDIVLRLLQIIEEWSEQHNVFWKKVKDCDPAMKESVTIQSLTKEHEEFLELYKKGQSDIDQLQVKCHGFTDQVLRLRTELELTKSKLQETAENLDESKESLRRVEKTLDREKSAIVSAVTSGEIFGENWIGTPDALTPTSGPAESKMEMSSASRDELLQQRELAASRLVELEELKVQRIQLKNDLDQVRLQMMNVPEERIQDSQHVRALVTQMQYLRNDAEHFRNETTKIRAEMEELHNGRRKFMESLEAEEKSRRSALEAELKKLESDISRVRDSRDRFQQMYEARCTKDEHEMQQNQEIRKIANTRKDRILTLTADVQRLQIMLAASTGDKEAFAFYLKGGMDKSFLDDLKLKLRLADDTIQNLRQELEAAKVASSQMHDLESVTLEKIKLEAKVAELTRRSEEMDALLGENADSATKALMSEIETKNAKIQQLELKVQAHEAVQAPLLSELHTVATAWGQLEEATSRKVIDLAQKEDMIYKLLSDKTRQESKCNLLIRAKDASANMTAVMKRQSDMQLDQIRKLEDREKNLNMQLVTLEREQAGMNSSIAVHKAKLQEFTLQNSTFKDKFGRQEDRLQELSNLLKERTEAYENESHTRKRLLEEQEVMKRKIEEYKKNEESSAGESEAAKQAARYLKLLKCPACDLNFKSHVILRCMHVFCKSCMDNQMEYRQRKCPTCRENFGAKDVKEIYL